MAVKNKWLIIDWAISIVSYVICKRHQSCYVVSILHELEAIITW